MKDLKDYHPEPQVRRRAEAAGIDLERLKAEDPTQYAMVNAKRAVTVPSSLMGEVGARFYRLFPEHQVFSLPPSAEGQTGLLVFPPLDRYELESLGTVLSKMTMEAPYAQSLLFYRVVQDRRGEHHELAFPFTSDAWPGIAGVMVGPFVTQEDADRWGDLHVTGRQGLVFDSVNYAGRWFVDVFVAEE
jgi:hypothetical protein